MRRHKWTKSFCSFHFKFRRSPKSPHDEMPRRLTGTLCDFLMERLLASLLICKKHFLKENKKQFYMKGAVEIKCLPPLIDDFHQIGAMIDGAVKVILVEATFGGPPRTVCWII